LLGRSSTTLWRYSLAELWRLIVLTTGVLVAVIAFAAAIKPLADGKIGPLDMLKFMGLAVVPMMEFALPFAAGFAATLAYHRLAQDNELTAAHASGVSHRSVLLPATASGLVLAAVLFGLTQMAIPRFLRAMENMITQDLTKILISSVERGEAVELDGKMIYADAVRRIDNPTGGAQQQLQLVRMAAVEMDDSGTLKADATATAAHLWLYPGGRPADESRSVVRRADEDAGMAVIQLDRAVHASRGKSVSEGSNLRVIIPASTTFRDDPKFLTYAELRALRAHPERMNFVEWRRRDLAFHLGERLTTETIRARLKEKGLVRFVDEQGQTITIVASDMSWDGKRWVMAPPASGGLVEVAQLRQKDPMDPRAGTQEFRWTVKRAAFRTWMGADDPSKRELSIQMELDGPTLISRGQDPAGERARLAITTLALENTPLDELLDAEKTPSARLLEMVRTRVEGDNPDPFLAPPYNDLKRTIERLHREITSKQHERWAMSAACLVMVVSGAVTAVTLSQSLPLTVYLWSFFPALATVITISSGQQITHDKGPIGLIVLWGGVAAFGVYALAAYWKLARH
jgi:lipopolysaccharide export LptBFGC system permease protein LptF